MPSMVRCSGTLLVFCVVPFLRWHELFYFGVVPPLAALAWTLAVTPESPTHLAANGKEKAAKQNLKWLHGEEK